MATVTPAATTAGRVISTTTAPCIPMETRPTQISTGPAATSISNRSLVDARLTRFNATMLRQNGQGLFLHAARPSRMWVPHSSPTLRTRMGARESRLHPGVSLIPRCHYLVLDLRLFVAVRLLPRRQLRSLIRNLLVRNAAQNVGNAVQPCPFLIVRMYDVPRCLRNVRGRQHGVPRPRVVVPSAVRLQIHWAQLPAL